MSSTKLFLTFVFLIFHVANFVFSHIEINTRLGKIVGSTDLTSRKGQTIYSFRGIRYAKPPMNELRFKPPVPIEPWSDTYNATVSRATCPQPSSVFGSSIVLDEDCLFLNVYTNQFPENTKPLLPVLVFIFGGGFYFGSDNSFNAGPHYLLDHEIILVTLSYRLGALGFNALNKDTPGNNGLKDQVMALKWVKDNIRDYGGNPDSVTLFGLSTGSISVSLHLVSPMSTGLFHRAICDSGTAFGQYPVPETQFELAQQYARILGCPNNNSEVILDCLRQKPALEIAEHAFKLHEFNTFPMILWSYVIEKDYGQERFLTEHPIKTLLRSKLNVPIMLGISKNDFGNLMFDLYKNKTLLKQIEDNFEKYAPMILRYETEFQQSKDITKSLRSFYFGNHSLNNSLLKMQQVISDGLTGFGVHRAANLLSSVNSKPVYYYEFTFPRQKEGVFHADTEFYLFHNSNHTRDPLMIEKLTKIWANFVKTGTPNPEIDWEPYNVRTKKYLHLGKTLVMRDHLFEKRYAFWRLLFPLKSYCAANSTR